MKKTYESRYNAIIQVVLVFDKYKDKYQQIPILIELVDELKATQTNTKNLITKVGSIPSLTAANKQMARADLIAPCLQVSNLIKVYAFIGKDENLLSSLNTNPTDFLRLRHQQLLDYAKFINTQMLELGDALTPYGLNEELKAELTQELKDYEACMSEPRQLINERKTNNELITNYISDATELLNDKIDPLMELFNEDQAFYLEYKSARMIVDPATRKRVNIESEVN